MEEYTKEDGERISLAKLIITKTFAATGMCRKAGIIALSEMLVSALAQGPKNMQELNQCMDIWHEKLFKEIVKTLGPIYIKDYAELREMERKHPGAIDAMLKEALDNSNSAVKIVMVDNPEDMPGAMSTPSPTKH